jgi:hypothetical protein
MCKINPVKQDFDPNGSLLAHCTNFSAGLESLFQNGV